MTTETSTDLNPVAVAAANWWAQQIGCPQFKAVTGDEPRAERDPLELAGVMAAMLAHSHPVTEDAGQKFAALLAKHISDSLTRQQAAGRVYGVTLSVDYGPDRTLGDIAEAAGVSTSRFPWKTTMWVQPDYVTASLGYGANARLVWSAPDWERPACGQHRYSADYETAYDETCGLPKYHDEREHDAWEPDVRRCEFADGDAVCGLGWAAHYDRRVVGHTMVVDGREQW